MHEIEASDSDATMVAVLGCNYIPIPAIKYSFGDQLGNAANKP